MTINHRLVKVFVRALIIAALTSLITIFAFWYDARPLLFVLKRPVALSYPIMVILLGMLLGLLYKIALTTLVQVKSHYALGYNTSFILFLIGMGIYINHTRNYNHLHGYDYETRSLLYFTRDSTVVGTSFHALGERLGYPHDLHLKACSIHTTDTLVNERQDTMRRVYFSYCYNPVTDTLFARIAVFRDLVHVELWDEPIHNNAGYVAEKKRALAAGYYWHTEPFNDKILPDSVMKLLPDSDKKMIDSLQRTMHGN